MSNTFGLPAHLGQAGSCIVCLHGTDTALGFVGSIEWVCAGLMNLGVPDAEAVATVENSPIPVDGSGRFHAVYRVCSACVSETNLPAPSLIYNGGEITTITQLQED